MCYVPDVLDQWAEFNRQLEEALEKLPECCECGEAIQDEYCFEINGEYVCERCLMDNHRQYTEYLVM